MTKRLCLFFPFLIHNSYFLIRIMPVGPNFIGINIGEQILLKPIKPKSWLQRLLDLLSRLLWNGLILALGFSLGLLFSG